MNILVTGSNGFVGKNLVEALKNIRDKKDKRYPELVIDNVFEFDVNSSAELLDNYCKRADFVFNFAGINRPQNNNEFIEGNCKFISELLSKLKIHNNTCPVMISSSIQASLTGRYKDSEYGKSKLAGEQVVFNYSNKTGAKVFVYRFPNIFGKWCRPNYNSVIATFCNNIANDLPITVNNELTEIELLYIDDLVDEMINVILGKEHHCEFNESNVLDKHDGKYCYVPCTYRITLGEIVNMLNMFKSQTDTLIIPEIPKDSFAKKLYSTYLSYLPKEKIAFDLKMNKDVKGSFTEIIKTANCGQFSVNISKPGVIKGQHWHNSKWEFFIVVSGNALIEERKIGTNEIIKFEVSGENLKAVHMLPGYTHNIINLSHTDDLITLMWANELFDSDKPDTFFEEV